MKEYFINVQNLKNLSNIEELLQKGIYFCEECKIIIDNKENIEIICDKNKLKKKFKFENIKEMDNYIYTHKIMKLNTNTKDTQFVKIKINSLIQKIRQKIDYKFEFIGKSLNYLDNLEKNDKIKKSYKDIIKEIINMENIEERIIILIKILISKDLQKYDKDIDNNNINIIEKYFLDINLKFKDKINSLVKEATNLSINLSNEEINDLKKNIKELFSPVNNNIESIEKNKYFIEKYLNFSNILNKYISKEFINNENNYINIEETLKDYTNLKKPLNSQNPNFILSLISKCFEKIGVKIYITKKNDNKIKHIEIASIQSLFSVGSIRHYEIYFDFGEKENMKILNNKSEQNKFLEKYKAILSKYLKLENNNLILTNVRHGCIRISAFILDPANENSFQNLNLNDRENLNITRIVERPIFEQLQINENILEPLADRDIGWWGEGEKRGGNEYIPPLNGWVGIGLKVLDRYDNGNNDWIGFENEKGEFSIGYIGIYNLWNDRNQIIENLNEYIQDINLMQRDNIYFNNLFNCGDGICVFQNPDFAENSAGYVDILGQRIKILLMCRVNPQRIRNCNSSQCWILNPTPDEIRPYRILLKKVQISSPLSSENLITTSIEPVSYILDSINSNDFSFYSLQSTESENYKRIKKLNYSSNLFVLKLYSSQEYKIINNYLRKRTVEKYSEEEIKSWICCLHNSIVNGNNRVENDTTVYRGTNIKFPEEIGIGSKFYFREFISTSLRREVSELYTGKGTLFVIIIKNNGTNGQQNYCLKINDISDIPDEEEVLFTCHCYFTISNIERREELDIVNMLCEGYKFD